MELLFPILTPFLMIYPSWHTTSASFMPFKVIDIITPKNYLIGIEVVS